MTELKTLKDLRNRPLRSEDNNKILDYFLLEKELRVEAIKWVKCDDENATTDSTDAWIKHFFNLTEEDFK